MTELRKPSSPPLLVQSDFDGTMTLKDISFLLLDTFGDSKWRRYLELYREDKISVNEFNRLAFSTIKEDRPPLEEFVRSLHLLRPGLGALIDCCHRHQIRLVIVSNGLDFYIKTLLKENNVGGIEVYAARAQFTAEGIVTLYLGPEGQTLGTGFKEAYTRHFLKQGYRVIYLGNGLSDIAPATLAHHVFAREDLRSYYEEAGLSYTPFNSLEDVAVGIDKITESYWPQMEAIQ